MYIEKAKADKQIGHAFENSIPMILWLGEDELKNGEAKLKILYKHE
jgi:histidyl-tRNA synthetase